MCETDRRVDTSKNSAKDLHGKETIGHCCGN